ncbi:hypothetical protein PV325_004676 [Microctonus aethiopoides]|uniref:Uncharacterized protein n=1 Tax=Microctonus aethiopoides TaxID=144406 RepID=A0AA39C8Z5_9HYME|nr:hypothetical protein PV325_004676 [Microctonus aethiopoides]KAK0098723.1 hypothetical protein PV326_004616 [Microctonus aethiopoides]KAK0160043.1 hypothetical protein PV328_007488 [Microctonus aethiopoides]
MAGGKRSQESMNEMIKNEQSNKMKEALDQLIKQDMKMKDAVDRAQRSLSYWQSHEIALKNSNEKLKVELKILQQENDNLTQQISIQTESHDELDEELKKYAERNEEEDQQFMMFCEAEIDKYRNLFTCAPAEYNAESLKNDIEHYRKMSNDILNHIERIDNERDELSGKYGLIELDTDEKAKCSKELEQFEKIQIDDDKQLSLTIRSSENKLEKLNSKIRQKHREIENLLKKIKKPYK